MKPSTQMVSRKEAFLHLFFTPTIFLCTLSWHYYPQSPSLIPKQPRYIALPSPPLFPTLFQGPVTACHTVTLTSVKGQDHQCETGTWRIIQAITSTINWGQLTASTRPFSVGFFSMRASNTSSVSLRTYSRTVCWKEKEEAGRRQRKALMFANWTQTSSIKSHWQVYSLYLCQPKQLDCWFSSCTHAVYLTY